MRIRILSDLHREFGATTLPQVEVELIVLAGDIDTKQNGLAWITEFCRGTPTVYICGNHEFYGDKLPRVTERLKERKRGTNIHVLENEWVTVNGWHIFGATLWTDLALCGAWTDGCEVAGASMNDYKRIRNSDRGFKRLTPRDTRGLHLESLRAMERFFQEHDPSRSIIVTHHAPSIRSLSLEDHDQAISCAYASHLDSLIEKYQPKLWIHGHIHRSRDYRIGTTRILSNPQGYPDTPNAEFDPALVIELESEELLN